MNGRQLQALAVSGIFGLVGGALSIQFVGARAAYAQPSQQEHLRAGSLRIVHGQATVAALSTYPPDNSTKLILRDKNGRQGLILSVSDAPGRPRAQIEFYDANGKLVSTLDGGPTAIPRVPRRLKGSGKGDGYATGRQLSTVIDELDSVVAMVNDLADTVEALRKVHTD